MSISANDFLHHDHGTENAASDTDTDTDGGSDTPDDYQPISAVDSDPDDESAAPGLESNGGGLAAYYAGSSPLQIPDFALFASDGPHVTADGVSRLRLNTGDDVDEEEDKRREAAELAVSRAFRDDEERRSAPLTPENASRVVEAMRGVVFPGVPPDWADRIPEDRWLDQLTRLREPNPSS